MTVFNDQLVAVGGSVQPGQQGDGPVKAAAAEGENWFVPIFEVLCDYGDSCAFAGTSHTINGNYDVFKRQITPPNLRGLLEGIVAVSSPKSRDRARIELDGADDFLVDAGGAVGGVDTIGFGDAQGNVTISDTANNMIISGDIGKMWELEGR